MPTRSGSRRRTPLDNNLSERVLRGPVIARYTSFGSGGPDGARAAGLLFGWQDQPHRPLERVLRQARCLLFPWVRVQCLASKVLALSLRQLAADWQREHGVRPLLVQTYVSQPYAGTCYRASNWRYLDPTQARGAMGNAPANTPTAVFVYPLQRDWQAILLAPQRPARSR